MRALSLWGYALVLLALLVLPAVVTGSYYQFMLIIVFIYSIVAIGLNILSGYSGQFSLGHAALMAMGAYTSALVSKGLGDVPLLASSGLNVWIGMALGVLMAAIAGALLAYPALRVKGPYLAMVTIAFGWVVWKVLLEWVSVTGGELGIPAIPKARLGPLTLTTGYFYYFALAMLVLALVVQRNLVVSSFGRKLVAIKHSEVAAASTGLDVYRFKVKIFIISAMFAGLGGGLFAHQQNFINPDNFQFFSSVFFLLAVLFGGPATLVGPLIGVAVLTLLPEMLHDFDRYRLIVYGVLTLAVLYFLPRGIAGLLPGGERAGGPRAGPQPAAGEASARPDQSSRPVAAGNPGIARGSTPARVELQEISKAFGGLQALDGVNLAIEPGTVHAVIGPNGAGKTTLINILSGLYQPGTGHVLLDGQPVAVTSLHAAARLGIARTFQTIKLFGDMTVLDHVMVGFERHGGAAIWDVVVRSPRWRRTERAHHERAMELVEFVGLGRLAHTPANALAYGHRRLVEVARALAVEPRLLLLDEPAAGLIRAEIETLDDLIAELRRQRITVLLVEHHMDLVNSISDRVTVLDYGKVIAEGDPAAIQRDPAVIEAYLGPQDHAAVG